MREEMMAVIQGEEVDIQRFWNSLPESTRVHSMRVAKMTERLLFWAGEIWEEEPLACPLNEIYRAVFYHDIGMALIPERLLLKSDELTGAERKVVERHVRYGAKLLDKYRTDHNYPADEEPMWQLAAEVAGTHHERWDGRGYPYGLLATAVPVVSRAVAITDTYDAIVSGSSFRMALPHEYALFEIVDNAGTQFDPVLVDVFKRHESGIC